MSDGADFRQQEEVEEFQQYLEEQSNWFKKQLSNFNETFGVNDEHIQQTK